MTGKSNAQRLLADLTGLFVRRLLTCDLSDPAADGDWFELPDTSEGDCDGVMLGTLKPRNGIGGASVFGSRRVTFDRGVWSSLSSTQPISLLSPSSDSNRCLFVGDVSRLWLWLLNVDGGGVVIECRCLNLAARFVGIDCDGWSTVWINSKF